MLNVIYHFCYIYILYSLMSEFLFWFRLFSSSSTKNIWFVLVCIVKIIFYLIRTKREKRFGVYRSHKIIIYIYISLSLHLPLLFVRKRCTLSFMKQLDDMSICSLSISNHGDFKCCMRLSWPVARPDMLLRGVKIKNKKGQLWVREGIIIM